MRDYILEKHPDLIDIFDICVQMKMDSDKYWCYLSEGKAVEDLYAEDASPFAAVFTKLQNGYKLADEKYPYPSEEELLEHVKELHVKPEDMKKSKWELLAEAYCAK